MSAILIFLWNVYWNITVKHRGYRFETVTKHGVDAMWPSSYNKPIRIDVQYPVEGIKGDSKWAADGFDGFITDSYTDSDSDLAKL